jgi:CRP/FNR family transcriptional regulator, anaerobic regulatory protein
MASFQQVIPTANTQRLGGSPDNAGAPHGDFVPIDAVAPTDNPPTVPAADQEPDTPLLDPLMRAFATQLKKHQLSFTRSQQKIRPRRTIYMRSEACEDVCMLSEGWACRIARLSDGRRQILSFLLPGDLFSATSVFQRRMDFYVEAITEVRFATIKGAALRAKLTEDPSLLESFMAMCAAESNYAHQRIVDLGQRSAEEKITMLIVQLMERLDARGLVRDLTFPFPLRQLQIADAVGLTPVHVNRIMSMLRHSGLIETHKGSLKILDLPRLQRISGSK